MNRLLSSAALAVVLAFTVPAPIVLAGPVETVVKIDKPAAGTPILIAMPETAMVLLTTAGADPKEEWNQNARKNLNAAAMAAVQSRGYTAQSADPTAYEGSRDLQLLKLNDTVTSAIEANRFVPLPTKTSFDWTLGEGAAELRPDGEAAPAAYVLFVHANGQYSSGGRMAMGILMAAAAGGGAGAAYMGGSQTLSATMVDLNTGKVVWYRQIVFAGTTDMRTEEGDKAAIESLFKTLPL